MFLKWLNRQLDRMTRTQRVALAFLFLTVGTLLYFDARHRAEEYFAGPAPTLRPCPTNVPGHLLGNFPTPVGTSTAEERKEGLQAVIDCSITSAATIDEPTPTFEPTYEAVATRLAEFPQSTPVGNSVGTTDQGLPCTTNGNSSCTPSPVRLDEAIAIDLAIKYPVFKAEMINGEIRIPPELGDTDVFVVGFNTSEWTVLNLGKSGMPFILQVEDPFKPDQVFLVEHTLFVAEEQRINEFFQGWGVKQAE
jgi:hypothetical protein